MKTPTLYDYYDRKRFSALECLLTEAEAQQDKKKGYISPEELATVLRTNPDIPIPPKLLEYICQTLEGKIKRPLGRKRKKDSEHLRQLGAIVHYKRLLRLFEYYESKTRNQKWSCMHDKVSRSYSAAERAARIAINEFKLSCDWRHIQNLATKYFS